jgi:iron complex outermembrane recepter protein
MKMTNQTTNPNHDVPPIGAGRFLHRALAVAAALLLAFLSASPVAAQTGSTGAIRGRVYNPVTGQYVRDAEIRLEGTQLRTYSEEGGQFQLNNVPAGQATLVVEFTGYQTVTAAVSVSPGQVTTRDVDLVSTADATVKLDAFVVSTEREGNAKAIMAQRRAMNITTSVASDVFGDVSEGNVGEFLKFLPGVDVEYVDAESRGPRLGGLDPQYVGVTMDGARLASADAFASYNNFINGSGAGEGVRSVGFEQLSINSIESIEVSRTLSPDMDADSPAGSINLKTRRGFDRKGRRIDWQVSMTANSDDIKWNRTHRPGDEKYRLIRPSWKLDYSDVLLDRRLGVSFGLSESKVLVQQQSVTNTYSRATTAADPRPIVLTGVSFGDGPKFLDRNAASLNLDFKASSRLVLSMNTIYSTYSGRTFSRSIAFTAANNNTNGNTGRATVLGDGLTEIRTNGLANNTGRTVGIAGGQNFDKRTKTITLTPRFEYTLGKLVVDGTLNYSRSRNWYTSLPYTIRTESLNNLTGIDFVATRPNANSPEWTIRQTGGPDWANLANYTNPRLSSNENRGALVKVYQADINARYTTPWTIPTFFKLGAKVNEEYRESYNKNAADLYSYIGPGGNILTGFNPATGLPIITATGSFGNFVSPRLNATRMGNVTTLTIPNIPRNVNRQGLAEAFLSHPEWWVDIATPANYYTSVYANTRDFKQTVPALYGMANTRLGKWQFQGGLRWEKTETQTKEWDPVPAPQMLAEGFTLDANRRATTKPGLDYQFGSRPRVKRKGDYDNFFPSVSAKYSIRPNLQAQFGYSHAISRPPINALAGVWVINDEAVPPTVIAPNTALKPERSNNYVARLAYYFEPVGSLTFLLQQNEITDIRESIRLPFAQAGITDDPAYADYEFITTRNVDRLFRYRNMEVGYNQQLSFLPGPLRNTNLNVNYSRSYANMRKPGTVPHKFSGGVSFNFWRIQNLRLNAIWLDDAQWTTTIGRYQRQNLKVDLSGNLRLTQRTSLFIQGRNIFNTPRQFFDPNPGTDIPPVLQSFANYGVSWAIGIRGNF